jgi:zinc protease
MDTTMARISNTIKLIAYRAINTPAIFLFCLVCWSPQAAAGVQIQQWTHSSGAKVYLGESPAIPMVDVLIEWDAGSRRDPAAQMGLAAAAANMLNKGVAAQGGAAALDENAVGEAWADLGASFNASASSDRFSASLRSLTYPDLLDKAAALAARMLSAPAWNEPIWLRERERWAAGIKEANTRPATIANRTFGQAVYGRHPYGYEPTEASLSAISVAAMQAFYARHIAACNAKVNIVGALNRAQADALVSRLLQGLAKTTCSELPLVPEVAALSAPQEQRLPFDAAQAHVLIGQPGHKRVDPDFFPIMVGNYVLGGGGFVSRLSTEVREKRGLSYSVYSYFSPGMHAGAFTIGLQTRPDQVNAALKVSREVLGNFVANGPTNAEVQAAKDFLINGFALRLDSNRKLLDNIANISWNNLPLNYLDTWTQQIEKVTAADIKAAFARKLQPERMVTVVVGGAP